MEPVILSKRPHIIYLMADQLRLDVIGAYERIAQASLTPNIDELAKVGTVFGNHITPCPLCVPTRSSIMTGRWPHRHGAMINSPSHGSVHGEIPLVPERLAASGYRVVHSGIQHVRRTPSFEAQEGVEFTPALATLKVRMEQLGLNVRDFQSPNVTEGHGTTRVVFNSNAQTGMWPGDSSTFLDIELTEQIVRIIEGHDPERPLALFGMYWAPHPPWTVPEPWWSMFNPDEILLPSTVGVWCEGQSPLSLMHRPGQIGAGVPKSHWPRVWAAYFGLVALLDECIGRVLAALRSRGMYDDSMVVFTADHGEMLGNHALLQKSCMYEEAVNVPLITKFPRQTTRVDVDDLTSHVDLAPTLYEVARIEPPDGMDGAPLSQAGASTVREHAFSEYHGNSTLGYHQWMVRSRTHKLIDTGEYGMELYDLVNDPFEERNLIHTHAPPSEALGPLKDALDHFRAGSAARS